MIYNKKCIYNFRLLYLYINLQIKFLIIMGFINLGFIYNKNTISLYKIIEYDLPYQNYNSIIFLRIHKQKRFIFSFYNKYNTPYIKYNT